MRHLFLRVTAGVCLFAVLSWSSPHATSGPLYPTLICVVPLVGAGTLNDPRRPMFTPVAGGPPDELAPVKKSKGFAEAPQIVGYHSVLTDDGQHAIVEFIARDRAAFQPILKETGPLAVFDLQKTPPAALLESLRNFKKNFDLRMLRGGSL